jgi:hypothetical protein
MDAVNGDQGDEATVTISSKLHFVDLAGSERLKYLSLGEVLLITGIRVLRGNVQRKVSLLMLGLRLWEKSSLNCLREVERQDIFHTVIRS